MEERLGSSTVSGISGIRGRALGMLAIKAAKEVDSRDEAEGKASRRSKVLESSQGTMSL